MDYLNSLKVEFEKNANPGRALSMKSYMKDIFPFFGIDTKTRRSLQKDFLHSNGVPEKEQLFNVINELWSLPQREYQYFALDLLIKFEKKLEVTGIQNIENLIITKSWWDTVDGLAAWICGSYFKLFPEKVTPVTQLWVDSENIWLQRSALLFQLKYKVNTDTEILSHYIIQLSNSNEFFIRKAIGWILREYSKTNAIWVREFVANVKLSPLSYREATKYI